MRCMLKYSGLKFSISVHSQIKSSHKSVNAFRSSSLNMLKTNTENVSIGQLLSPTYHSQISPLATDTSAIFFVGISNCYKSLETLSPEIPSWKLYQLLPLHTHKKRSAWIVHKRMLFHCLAIGAPAVQAATDSYYPKDSPLSDLQMLRHRYKLSSTTQCGKKGERSQGYWQFLYYFLCKGNRKQRVKHDISRHQKRVSSFPVLTLTSPIDPVFITALAWSLNYTCHRVKITAAKS